jgi:hypothetical protein
MLSSLILDFVKLESGTGSYTLLLHKGVVESAAYHHKKAVSTTLMKLFKDHYLGDPVDYVDLTAVPLWSRV